MLYLLCWKRSSTSVLVGFLYLRTCQIGNNGTSSVANSNWKYNYSVDTNSKDEVSFSKFDVVMLQASY